MQRVCLASGPPHAAPLPRIFFLPVLSRIFFLLVYHGWPCSGTLTTSSVTGLLCRCHHSCAFSVTGRGPQLYTMFVSPTRFLLYPPESSVPTLVSDIQLAFNKYFLKDGGRKGGRREGGKREGEGEEPPKGSMSFRFTALKMTDTRKHVPGRRQATWCLTGVDGEWPGCCVSLTAEEQVEEVGLSKRSQECRLPGFRAGGHHLVLKTVSGPIYVWT